MVDFSFGEDGVSDGFRATGGRVRNLRFYRVEEWGGGGKNYFRYLRLVLLRKTGMCSKAEGLLGVFQGDELIGLEDPKDPSGVFLRQQKFSLHIDVCGQPFAKGVADDPGKTLLLHEGDDSCFVVEVGLENNIDPFHGLLFHTCIIT